MDQRGLYARAVAALYRTERSPSQPDEALSGVEQHGGKVYVVLRNVRGVIAVYRVRNDQMLKRLKRLPLDIEHDAAPQPVRKRQLTAEEIASIIPDDAWKVAFTAASPADVREAYVRGRREFLAAMWVAEDVAEEAKPHGERRGLRVLHPGRRRRSDQDRDVGRPR